MGEEKVWKSEELSRRFLKNVRGAIPMAGEATDVMMRVIGSFLPGVGNFLDLGCGDGILSAAIIAKYPLARGTLLDFSETMLKEARIRFKDRKKSVNFIRKDFGKSAWVGSVIKKSPFDVIVSGLAIHHETDERKRRLYREIFRILRPGGVFINFEHVSSATERIERIFDNLFIDSLYAFNKKAGSGVSRKEVVDKYYNRPDKKANILAPVEAQCEWLRGIGFEDVDCYFKIFELAVFGGSRPL